MHFKQCFVQTSCEKKFGIKKVETLILKVKSLLSVCIFHTRCSLQSQSWFYNGPNQDRKIMATCLYQLTHKKLNQLTQYIARFC